MSDLFDYRDKYPHQPAFRRTATSKAAAESVTPRAPNLRDQVLDWLKHSDHVGGLTADQCALIMGKSVLSIRPRFSELVRRGLIFDTGITRANESGVQASVWRAF